MALELPQYLQNGTYPARLDRLLVQHLFGQQERVIEGFVVSQKAVTQDTSIDVTAGAAVVMGDSIARQGMYLATSDATDYAAGKFNFVMPTKPGSNSRWDVVGIQIRDAQAAGSGSFNDAVWAVVQGTAAGSPTVPTSPASFLAVARVLRTAAEGAILAAAITDVAPRAPYPYGYGDNAPTGTTMPGSIWIEY